MHETVETLETLSNVALYINRLGWFFTTVNYLKCLNCLKNLMQIFALQGDFLHDKLDKAGKVPLQLVKLVNFAISFFYNLGLFLFAFSDCILN